MQLNFNAHEVAPATTFEALPIGDYLAIVEGSQVNPTRDNAGEYIELTFQILEGEYKGRKVWERITWRNASDKAMQFGRSQLSSLCRAVGVMNLNDTSELHNKPVMIKLGVEKRVDTGALTNRVKGYVSLQPVGAGNVAGAVQDGSSKPGIATATGATPPPWMKK